MSPGILSDVACLVVDDDDDYLEILTDALVAHGAVVRTARSGDAAMRVVEEWRPDVLLSDLTLPDTDGFDLLRRIRTTANGADVSAIALTGRARASDREASLQAGFEKHLVKPASLHDIVAAIHALRHPAIPAAPGSSGDLRLMLAQVNAALPCRFTSLLRFAEDGSLVSLWTHDRERPGVDPFPVGMPLHASYCVLVRDTGRECVIGDASHDPRVADHPMRTELACYVGAPVFRGDGSIFGAVCSYDVFPRAVDDAGLQQLCAMARELEPRLRALFESDVVAR